jgi:hypothetical protein
MGEYMSQIPVEIQGHIRQITKSSGLPDTEDSLEMIAQGWLEKKERFERHISRMALEEVDVLERADTRGCLAMTYSGSLINIGPQRDQGRNVQYVSIGLRKDVPESASQENSQLEGDVKIGSPVSFSVGPIQSSSPVFKIAVTAEELDLDEQERQIRKSTEILTKEFVKVNKELDEE